MRLACAALLLVACTQRTQLLAVDGGTACSGTGMPIRLGTACAATLASTALRPAVCSCASLILANNLVTEDSPRMMPGPPGHPPMPPAAAVATNGSLQVGGQTQVGGTVAAGSGMSFSATASVFGNLRSGGSVSATQLVAVGGDAFVGGDVLGRVDVAGALHVSPGSTVAPTVNARDVTMGPLDPVMPCDCATPVVDVPALVAAARAVNDDAAIRLDPAAPPPTLDLPCGRYYVAGLKSAAAQVVTVHGRTALFVGGDVALGSLRVDVDPGAELDFVVGGNVTVGGDLATSGMASSLRVWMGGRTLRLMNGGDLVAEVWAPSATLFTDAALTIVGSVAVASTSIGGDLTVRYDPRVLAGGSECGDPPAPPLE